MAHALSPLDIRIAFLEVGKTIQGVADKAEVSAQFVSMVVQGKRRTPHIRRHIAAELGMTYLRVWGEEDPGIDRIPPAGRQKVVTPSLDVASAGVAS